MLIAGLILIGVLLFALINFKKPAKQPNKLQVAASFYPLYFFAEQIGGDKADVINITPAGAEPHDYEPTAQDIAKIENSKMIILNGGGLEAWGQNLKQNINPSHTIIVVAGEVLTNQQFIEDGKSIIDPHVWLSPVLAKKMADKIVQGFVEIDSKNKDYYLKNRDALKAKLDDLDNQYKEGLANCNGKSIVTSHAAFGYLADTYGFKQIPISGLSPDAEPSPKQLAEIAKFVKSNNINYIFFESLVSPKLSDTIASEAGAKTLVLNPIEGLTNEQILQGKNYFTEMQNNLTNLKIALQCK